VEEKIVSVLMDQLHFWLIGGIIAFLYLLKSIDAIRNTLFSDKYRWLVTPINVVLSFVGVFVLGFTNVKTTSMKIIVMLIISAFATFAYEILIKKLEALILSKLDMKTVQPPDIPTPPTNPIS
jgi:hypothetical protein